MAPVFLQTTSNFQLSNIQVLDITLFTIPTNLQKRKRNMRWTNQT